MKYRDFIKTKKSCSFCVPKDRIILERAHAFVICNIAPIHRDQIMVIPKRHLMTVAELSNEEWVDIAELISEGISLIKKLGYTFASILARDGLHPGKSMEHLHFHLIPDTDLTVEPDPERAKREDKRDVLTLEEIEKTIADYERAKHV